MKHLTLSLIIVVIVAVMGTGWMVSEIYSHVNTHADSSDDGLNVYKQLGRHIALALDHTTHREEFIQYWQKQGDITLTFQDTSHFPVPKNLQEQFENGSPLLLESEGEVSLHVYMKQSQQVMTMLLPLQNNKKQKSLLSIFFTLLFYVIVVIVLLVWLYPLIKRLIVLRKSTREFGRGDLSSRILPSKSSYIADIEYEFNRMADRVQKLIDDNKLLSRAVSHDLKTPLTRLQFGVDVLEETHEEGARKKYIARINKDIHEMQSLVDTLLEYASLDECTIQLKPEHIELSTFIDACLDNIDHKHIIINTFFPETPITCLLYTSPSPRDRG